MLTKQLDAELSKIKRTGFWFTAATHQSQLLAFFRFCLHFVYRLVPCSSHNLLHHVVFLARALSSITCYLNIARILPLQCGFVNPLQDLLFKFQKDLLMHGIQRFHSNVVRRKLPITRATDILRKLHGQLDLVNSLIYSSRSRAHLTL